MNIRLFELHQLYKKHKLEPTRVKIHSVFGGYTLYACSCRNRFGWTSTDGGSGPICSLTSRSELNQILARCKGQLRKDFESFIRRCQNHEIPYEEPPF